MILPRLSNLPPPSSPLSSSVSLPSGHRSLLSSPLHSSPITGISPSVPLVRPSPSVRPRPTSTFFRIRIPLFFCRIMPYAEMCQSLFASCWEGSANSNRLPSREGGEKFFSLSGAGRSESQTPADSAGRFSYNRYFLPAKSRAYYKATSISSPKALLLKEILTIL